MRAATIFLLVLAGEAEDGKKEMKPDIVIGDLDGFYSFKSKAASGTVQTGVAVVKKINDAYVVSWNTTGNVIVGIGSRQGDWLSVGWAMEGEKGIVRGVSVYKVGPGPKLEGKYTTAPGNGRFLEDVLTFIKPLGDE